ncbi:alkyl hydroperoxide reductase large subunit [Leptospira ryugenii]|uniref:Alkyl hydroperoxide reductase large subunit n=1 Tax=Leptospira ryugenii TaxID=1917863 RepID=A0A2P2E1W8_9LEPT|nr:alkyl hydroperoxide reductase subunit F [Leptospira ryugenii]GBF50878.1 alkyl hydroperoxide reductase large subunit [Leptospira ryugenii]
MLDEDLKQQVKEYFKNLKSDVVVRLYPGKHESREELVSFLTDLVSLSDRLSLTQPNVEKSGVYFDVYNGKTAVAFDGIPGGHEFSSLVLAILQAGGSPLRLDASLVEAIQQIQDDLQFETYVALDCHNCPEVVQTLNAFSLVNPKIKNVMIDGALFPDRVNEKKIQGVPTVYLNGERFLSGQADTAKIFDKLLESVKLNLAPKETKEDSTVYDVTVIGGGPSGVASAVYTARKGLKVLLIAERMGGQVKDTVGIENIISVPYTTGQELSSTLAKQLESNQVAKRENVRVTMIEPGVIKKIHLNTTEVISTKTIIISTGAKWRELNVPGERENIGKGVAYCPHCDGPFFKNKDVVVVGGGNSGVEAALDLSGIVKSVTLIEFGDQLKADKVLVEKMEQTKNIRSVVSAETKEILSSGDKVTGLIYQDRKDGRQISLETDAVFVQIGLVPNSGFVKDLVQTNRFGEILVDEKCRTSVDGIFACGDVTQTPYKQIVIAMGEGAKAAISAFEHLLHAA